MTRVTVKLSLLDDIRKVVSDRRVKEDAGALLIKEMKDHIASGISPVRGERRFVGYKDPKKYPGDQKSKRPVNLYLSGDMLAALKFYPLANTSFQIAIKGEQGVKARAHNDGKGVPRRHFMPTEQGEQFTVSIVRKLKDYYARLILKASRGR